MYMLLIHLEQIKITFGIWETLQPDTWPSVYETPLIICIMCRVQNTGLQTTKKNTLTSLITCELIHMYMYHWYK